MPEHLAYDLGVHSLRQEQRRAGVPQVVEPDVGHLGFPQKRFEGAPAEPRLPLLLGGEPHAHRPFKIHAYHEG